MRIFKFNTGIKFGSWHKNNEFLDFVKRIQDEYDDKYKLDALKTAIILALCEKGYRHDIESANIARNRFSDFVNKDNNNELIQKYFGGTYEFFRFLYQQLGDCSNDYMFGIKLSYYCSDKIRILVYDLFDQERIALGRNYINIRTIDLNGIKMDVPIYGTMVIAALNTDKPGKLLGFIVNMLPEHVIQLLNNKFYLDHTTDKYYILNNKK